MLNIRLWVAGLVVVGALLGVSTVAGAQDSSCSSVEKQGNADSSACRVPVPVYPEGRGGQCVRDPQFMLRNHMNLILHQRDLTMHQGIRTSQYSLKGCVECHATQRADGSYLPINAPGQFCQSCHSYAGVHIDCFECHATTPAVPPATKP